jgi:hypothetical protein
MMKKAQPNKFTDPLYNQGKYPPIFPMGPVNIQGPLRGAGDPNYTETMKAGKKKPVKRK